MAQFDVEFKIFGIDEDDYQDEVAMIVDLLEDTGYRVEVGVGEESEE